MSRFKKPWSGWYTSQFQMNPPLFDKDLRGLGHQGSKPAAVHPGFLGFNMFQHVSTHSRTTLRHLGSHAVLCFFFFPCTLFKCQRVMIFYQISSRIPQESNEHPRLPGLGSLLRNPGSYVDVILGCPHCSLSKSGRQSQQTFWLVKMDDCLPQQYVNYELIIFELQFPCPWFNLITSNPVQSTQNHIMPIHMGVSENSVPLNPMVLLIIIPIKWLSLGILTQHFQTNPHPYTEIGDRNVTWTPRDTSTNEAQVGDERLRCSGVKDSIFQPEIDGVRHGSFKRFYRVQSPLKPIGSMVLLYMVTWIPSIYPQCEHIYHTWILWEIEDWHRTKFTNMNKH